MIKGYFNPKRKEGVLHIAGALLVLMEAYKQLFLTFVVYGGKYQWWYFPFQLCSIPMYLALFYPPGHKRLSGAFAVFIADFGLLGGVMTLCYPEGIIYPYLSLTAHGFIWHFILIFMAIWAVRSGLADTRPRAFLSAVPVFLTCAFIAFMIDYCLGPDRADMFYISPWHVSAQPVFHEISTMVGILPGIVIYLSSVLAGGYIAHRLLGLFFINRQRS